MVGRIGQQLGHYRLLRKLGSGGFADVYQAEHIYLNTPAAVKLLNSSLVTSDVQSFLNEAKTIAGLNHQHIVRVLDFGLEEGIPYLVMEYAPNGTLRQRHPKGSAIPLSLILQYTQQIASALQYAHMHRLIHRDVKPDNILLGRHNELLLSDFGAALLTRTSEMLSTQDIIGTISYMAPEQLRGKPTPASDQYALGVVVYEWLSGFCPFQGSPVAVYNLHLYETPPSLLGRVPALTPTVEQVVMKALAKQPEQRYQSVQAFAQALEQASKANQQRPVPAQRIYLPGNVSPRIQATSLATEAYLPTMPVPAPQFNAVPLPAPQPAPGIVRQNTMQAPQPAPGIVPPLPAPTKGNLAPSRHHISRRTFVSTLIGTALVAGAGGGVAWWVTEQGNSQANSPIFTPIYRGHKDQVFTAAWSMDDTRIASAGGNIGTKQVDTKVHVWNTYTGQDVYLYPGHSQLVRMVAWSPVEQRIASASADKTVQLWDANNGHNPFTFSLHTDAVMAVAWSPDGQYIASASWDGTVMVWKASNGVVVFPYTGHGASVTSVAWSPKGNYIASGDVNGKIHIWEAITGQTLHVLPQTAWIGSLAWSPDDSFIVTGDYNDDDSVRIWSIVHEKDEQLEPGNTQNQVYSVAWSPDGKFIAAGYQDTQVRVWSVSPKKTQFTYSKHAQPIMSAQWSHDGKYIASCGFDKTVRIWTPFS